VAGGGVVRVQAQRLLVTAPRRRDVAQVGGDVGQPQVVPPGQTRIAVSSWGVEEDGILEADEGAAGDQAILLPVGRFSETVAAPLTFTMDCPVSTAGDDFHYGVDVRWSVTYVP